MKELDCNIESVFILKDQRRLPYLFQFTITLRTFLKIFTIFYSFHSCIVTFLPFTTHENVSSAIASLKLKMRNINKTAGETCCKPCFRMRYFLTTLYEKTPNRCVICTDENRSLNTRNSFFY